MNIHYVNNLIRHQATDPLYRHKIFTLSNRYADFDLAQKMANTQHGVINREPWPFSDSQFGLITQSDGTATHYDFRNPSSFIVGSCEAYCSSLIYRQTGRWPRPIDTRGFPDIGYYSIAFNLWVDTSPTYGARNWAAFLILNHYKPVPGSPQTGHYYIGVRQGDDQPGLVVWFHYYDSAGHALVSTRLDGKWQVFPAPASDYAWFKIQ